MWQEHISPLAPPPRRKGRMATSEARAAPEFLRCKHTVQVWVPRSCRQSAGWYQPSILSDDLFQLLPVSGSCLTSRGMVSEGDKWMQPGPNGANMIERCYHSSWDDDMSFLFTHMHDRQMQFVATSSLDCLLVVSESSIKKISYNFIFKFLLLLFSSLARKCRKHLTCPLIFN
jgi:hypothetical protein